MSWLTLIFIALALSMDAFAVSISNTLCYPKLSKRWMFFVSFIFGLFQMIMPLIGYFSGKIFYSYISRIDHWVALILLCFIGGKMLYEAIHSWHEPANTSEKILSLRTILLQAIATSIDALAVGLSLGAIGENILIASSIIGMITLLCCLLGHLIGKQFGNLLGKRAEVLGGIILIVIGGKIFLEHIS